MIEMGIIPYKGSEIVTTSINGVVYVAMKPFVDAMGLNWDTQNEKLKMDDRFNYTLKGIVAKDGKNREMMCLEVYQLPAFLYSINPNKVRKDLKNKIIAFQSETFKVINEYWNSKEVTMKTFKGKSLHHVIIGLKSAMKRKDERIKVLENKLLTLPLGKNLDEKVQYIIKQTEETLKESIPDNNGLWLFFQNRASYSVKYIKYLKIGGSEWEKFALSEIEKYENKYHEAKEAQLSAENQRNLSKKFIKEKDR